MSDKDKKITAVNAALKTGTFKVQQYHVQPLPLLPAIRADHMKALSDEVDRKIRALYKYCSVSIPADAFCGVDRDAFPEPLKAPKPDPNIVEGLTRALCLERYMLGQRDQRAYYDMHLTPKQLAAAREEWAKALAAKQAEARDKDRRQVTCQSQYEMDEWP